jgi:hypothetical protein
MYKSSEKFSTAIEKNGGRTFKPKLIFDGFELETEIHSLNYNGGSNGEDNITIGSAVSATLEIKMDKVPHLLTKQNFSFNLGILCEDGSYEFIPMGKFNAEKPETTDYEINVTAYDNMVLAERTYNSQLTYPTTTTAVIKEICNAIGVSFVTEIESITINNPSSEEGASNAAFAGYTMREAIGYIAGLYGKFAIFNRLGQLEFRWYENSDYDVKLSKTYSFAKDEQDYSIDQLIVLQNQETTFKAGSGVNGISCSNPFATQSIVDAIYQKIGGFTFRKGTVKFLGDCRIDPWDIVTVEDLLGNTYKLPVMSISHSVDGGLTTNIESFSNDNDDVSDSFSGPVTKAMERTYAQLLVVNKLIADRVTADYVEANYVKTKEIDAIQANIETAVITNLQGKFATIEYIKANYATVENLNVAIGRISTLETNSLTANSAVITTLKSSVADINTLLFGNASGGSLSTEFSNSVVSLIGNAQIKSAMIESLDASKITALDLNTTKFKVHSENGMSYWQDNTIIIKDTKRVRVQIGKDANSDYNMYVWDKSGNLMFDAVGLTEKGINRPVIRNDMVKEDANISASKLDISSLFNAINNDGSHTLKSSKIYVDANKQTLDVAFKNMTTNVTDLQKSVTTQGAQLTTVQGQISSKVWQQDITTAVSNLQVGGRNLLKGTHSSGKTYSYPSSGYVDRSSWVTTVPLNGGTYTLSFWAKSTVSGDAIIVYFYNPSNITSINGSQGQIENHADGQCNFRLSTVLTKYWVTYTIPKNGNSTRNVIIPRLPSVGGKGTLTFQWEKLEEGNKATDWTPAPEDIDSSISTVEGKVTTISNQYTSLNQSLTSLTATVNSNTTKINSKADGSTVTALQSNMTALTADLNGFKTTVSSTYSTKTEFNNLQVGGRNLLTRTNQGKTYWSFNKQNGTVSIESYETIGVKINCTVASTGYAVILYAFEQKQVNLLEPNMEYVLSFDLISSNTVAASVRICQPDATDMLANAVAFHVDAGTKWVHKSVTLRTNALTLDKSNQFVYINGFNKVGTVCFKNLKLEKGNKATDWTPAPEDVDSSIKSVATIANQTANKFQWIVKSGTSSTDFTLTDRVASLLSEKFDIDALTTFKNSASNGTSTVINGGAIKANTITADKIKVDSLQAISAKIGGFTISDNNIASGTWGTSGSVMMCTGTDGAKPIGGSGTISGWCFTAGNAFGVTKAGALYASNVKVSGDITATSGTIGKLVINGNYLQADSGTSGNVYRMYIQKPTDSSTWCFSTQYGSTTKTAKFYATAGGEVYCTKLITSGSIKADADVECKNIECKNMVLGRGSSTATYVTADAYGSASFLINSSIRHVIGASEDTFYNKAHFSGTSYPQIYGNGTYLIFGYGNSQSIQLDNSKRFMPTEDNSYTLGYSGYRWKQVYAAAGSISTSDRNAKKDITELDNQSYDFVMGLKPSRYRFIENDSNRIHYGLIAQDVEELLGNLGIATSDFAGFVKSPKVQVDESTRKETVIDGEYEYGLRYEEFIAPIIKVLQMQDKKIKNLDNMVTHLIGIAMNHS